MALKLNKQDYPFAKTSEGVNFLANLGVRVGMAKQGKRKDLKRYAYCMAAGASIAEGKEFPFTVEQFIKACPPDWAEQALALMNEPDEPVKRVKKEKKESSEN